MNRDNKTDSMVREMTIIILVLGLLLQIALLFFAKERILASTGLWIGVMLAIFMLVYMYRILRAALGWGAEAAEKYVRRHSIVRYITVVVVYGVVIFARLGNPLACFAGILTLKAAAYIQPLCSKLKDKRKKE